MIPQSVGSDHRLFFQLAPNNLRVIDLVNRKDYASKLSSLLRLAPRQKITV